jgi:endonuclease G, mitochondrial
MGKKPLFNFRQVLVAAAALLISSVALARGIPCPQHFAGGQPPVFLNKKLATHTYGLCFEGQADMYSGVTRTPLWAAEHLTRDRMEAARYMKRHNAFHPEERLPVSVRSELYDYTRSGYDRGHMAPSGDMATEEAQYGSFSLANMIPQNPNNNQNLWEGIESSTRNLALQRGDIYVVTGPIFEGANLQRINGRVLVPTSIFKAIYDPARQEGAAYITPNAPGMDYQVVSIANLERRTGIDPFPAMPASAKQTPMRLPPPTPHGHGRSRRYSRGYDGYNGSRYRQYEPRQEGDSSFSSSVGRALRHLFE